jgi:hypothetical protein
MAYEESLRSISLDADASIGIFTGVPGLPGSATPNAGKQYCWVKVTGEHTAGLCTAAAGELPAGILQNKPQQVGGASTVGFNGVSKAVCGGAVPAGSRVGPDANGATVVVATGPAIALTTGATGGIIPVLIVA